LIDIFYTRFNKPLPEEQWINYVSLLPQDLQDLNRRFRRWQDQHRNLFGKLLLMEGLKQVFDETLDWSQLKYNPHRKPYLRESIDFNITHSGEFVICAIGQDIRLGIDIEEIRPMSLEDFGNVMSEDQWTSINSSSDPMKSFFRYWAIKESVIKADSRTFLIPLSEIKVCDDIVSYGKDIWYFQEFELDQQYCSCFTSNKRIGNIEFHPINFSN
jgi:4'-phosphopantetheinyl transferase